jgi:hypothetical protein
LGIFLYCLHHLYITSQLVLAIQDAAELRR